jgi:multidrug efflux system membrane fusion protein
MIDPKQTDSPLLTPDYYATRKSSGGTRLVFWLIVLAIVGGAAYYYYFVRLPAENAASAGTDKGSEGKVEQKGGGGRKGGPGAGAGPASVAVAVVKTDTLDVRLTALGTVTPRNIVTVHTRVDGPLLNVHFVEGQMVKTGQLLAEIDPMPLKAALDQAQGQLMRDQALLANALVDLDRYKGLIATDSVPKQQYDTQVATVAQYKGIVLTDQGMVDSARLSLSWSRIVSPISGQVGLRQVDPGNIVKAADTTGLVIITQMDPTTVVAAIPEGQVPALLKRMRESADVPVEAWDAGVRRILATGKLLSTDNQIDTTTGTLKLKAEFANPNLVLFPNQFVNVRVLLGQETNAIVIPQSGVQRGSQQGVYAFVVKDDSTVTVRTIKLGTVDGERVGVTSGLNVGERVVIDGADKLKEGAKVVVVDRSATPAPGVPGMGDGSKSGGKGGGKGGRHKGGGGGDRDAGKAPGGAAPAGSGG